MGTNKILSYLIRPMFHHGDLGVDFAEGGKPENPEKNPRSTGETNYNNTTHMGSKLKNQNGT